MYTGAIRERRERPLVLISYIIPFADEALALVVEPLPAAN